MVKIWTNSFKRNKRNHFAAKMLWLFITLTTFSATMQGQQSEKRISLEFKNERLADAFKKLKQQVDTSLSLTMKIFLSMGLRELSRVKRLRKHWTR